MQELLKQLLEGKPLSVEQATTAFDLIMSGQATPPQLAAMLALIQQRGPAVEEIAGAAAVMRAKLVPIEVPAGKTAVDTCGTGGDHASTFNVSTASAIVAAAAGRSEDMVVAKHGNRAVTSTSGSAQVFEALGLHLAVDPTVQTRCLAEAGLCFCFAPAHHPAMKHAVEVRKDLAFRTIFNIVGPLTNPAGAGRQLIGVYEPALTTTLAEVLQRLGSVDAIVACGQCGDGVLDELATTGPTTLSRLEGGRVPTSQFDPASIGLATVDPQALRVDSAEASAAMIRTILDGKNGPPADIVCLNAGAALVVGGIATDLEDGLARARDAITRGEARDVLETVIAITHEAA